MKTKYDQQYKLINELMVRLQSIHFSTEAANNWSGKFLNELKELASLSKDEFQKKYSLTLKEIEFVNNSTFKEIIGILKFNQRKISNLNL